MIPLLLTALLIQPPPELPPVRNLVRLSAEFCTAGQPTAEQLEGLRKAGFRSILNLRDRHEHDAEADRDAARRAGLRYVHIPVPFEAPLASHADEFLRATDDAANRPMLIHCAVGIRAAAFWMIRRVLREGWKLEDAQAEARRIGLARSPHLMTFATDYITKARGEAPPERNNRRPVAAAPIHHQDHVEGSCLPCRK